jgi:hypothetical protein
MNSRWKQLTRYRLTTCVLAGCAAVAVRLALLPYIPVPEPLIHDEFAYLLGADTFASGRLANPPHPMWQHFETHHVIFHPSYASKYPPGQSMVLAVGQRLLGHPWYGVLLSVGIMCAAIVWMFQAWLPPPYPVLGAVFAILQFGITSYWVNSYWGGAVAATGGALVAGAIPRLARRPQTGAAIAAAAGAMILANSRPYEGFFYVLASFAALAWWTRRTRRPLRDLLRTPATLAALVVLAAGIAWTAFYNYRVTGSPWVLPTALYQSQYSSTSQFLFVPEGPPLVYRHDMIRQMWAVWFHSKYAEARADPLVALPNLARILGLLFAPTYRFLMCLAVLFVPGRKVWKAAGIAGVCAGAILAEVNMEPHYLAPAVALLLFLAAVGLKFARETLRGQNRPRVAAAFVIGTLAVAGATEAFNVAAYRGNTSNAFTRARTDIVTSLSRDPSRHLVIVRYAPTHLIGPEWVYNSANIDESRIVWARDMGVRNQELVDYYPDRKVWLLEPDLKTDALKPYPPEPAASPAASERSVQ